MSGKPAWEALVRELRKVLPNLYNPVQIRHSPLVALFGFEHQRDATGLLQRMIAEAIGAMEPNEDCPVGSNAWRTYQVLHGRYIDQFSQEEMARDLFLSPRQLRRLEQNAVDVLADHLWAVYGLEERAGMLIEGAAASEAALTESGPSGRNEEFSWLERTVTNQMIDCLEFVQSAIQTAQPLLNSLQTNVYVQAPASLPKLSIHLTTARQALLHLMTLAAHQAGGGQVQIQAEPLPSRLFLRLTIHVEPGANPKQVSPVDAEEIEVAKKLIQLSKGTFELAGSDKSSVKSPGYPFEAAITLPTAEQVPVLVIDDNIDTLRLVERYLAGTSYRYMGVSHPAEAIEVAERTLPVIIIMDVMLPDMDGWELLGRLRTHPSMSNTSMVVCSILPQSQLALMLGAADFLSKPIRREALIAMLDRLVGLA